MKDIDLIFSKDRFVKEANVFDSFLSKVKDFFSKAIDPNNKVKSVFNILAPTGISLLLKSLGYGPLGIFLQIVTMVFKIDIYSIFESVYKKIKSLFDSNGHVTEAQLDNAVNSSVSERLPSNIVPDKENLLNILKKSEFNNSEIRILKLGFEDFNNRKENSFLVKEAGYKTMLLPLLFKLVKWVFYIGLAAAGILGAKKVYDYGKENKEKIKEMIGISSPNIEHEFKTNPSYKSENYSKKHDTWIENVSNNRSSIEDLVLNFANEVYPDSKKENYKMKNTPGFNKVVDIIEDANIYNKDGNFVMIPTKLFKSKKDIVDLFIDEVKKN